MLVVAGVSAILAAAAFNTVVITGAAVQEDALRKALTFHASFDGKVDAAHAAGDPSLYWAPS